MTQLAVHSPDPRIAFFDHQAPTWDQTGPDPEQTLQRLEEIAPRLGLRAGQDLLEVGCGTGQITGWLVDRVRPGRVTAVDFSPRMLEQARSRSVDAEFVLLDVCRQNPVQPSFDVVLCFHSFPHFQDQAAALRQFTGLLKQDGELLVVHLSGSRLINTFHHKIGGVVGDDRLPPAVEWPSLLQSTGLHFVEGIDREDLFLVRARRPA